MLGTPTLTDIVIRVTGLVVQTMLLISLAVVARELVRWAVIAFVVSLYLMFIRDCVLVTSMSLWCASSRAAVRFISSL